MPSQIPEWRKKRCVHCAAGLEIYNGLSSVIGRRHVKWCPGAGGDHDPHTIYVPCTALTETEYIAELEAKCEALLGALVVIGGPGGPELRQKVLDALARFEPEAVH